MVHQLLPWVSISFPDGKAGNVPPSWVIEFSNPVFGNRWIADCIYLTVQGRDCHLKLVSPQHNRRFVWAGSRLLWILNSVCWDRGACSNFYPKTSYSPTTKSRLQAIASSQVAMAIGTVVFNLVYAIPALWDLFVPAREMCCHVLGRHSSGESICLCLRCS